MARKPPKITVVFMLALALAGAAIAQTNSPASDASAIGTFEDEGLQHSQVMEVMGYLTDVYGPRLTNSPNPPASRGLRRKKR